MGVLDVSVGVLGVLVGIHVGVPEIAVVGVSDGCGCICRCSAWTSCLQCTMYTCGIICGVLDVPV